jgi:hypothetical protein
VTDFLTPGTGLFFMRVGTHARESLEEIVARKTAEIDKRGYTLWGYGGQICHPITVVQPFAKERRSAGKPLFLCMEEMVSERYFGEPQAASEYSEDGRNWKEIPADIEVRGSRYALRIDSLRKADFTLPLEDTRIPVGPSSGRPGSRFVRDNVDKACLVVEPGAGAHDEFSHRRISLVANVLEPYALMLRNFRPAPHES